MVNLVYLILSAYFASASVPTSQQACTQPSERSALVIIDMQPHFVPTRGKYASEANTNSSQQAIQHQISAINMAKQSNLPIIVIEYGGGEYLPTYSSIKDAIGNYTNVKYIQKSTDGMFDSDNDTLPELRTHLRSLGVGNLIITGANGGSCVQDSITGAIQHNCSVVAYNRAIIDFNFINFIYPYANFYGDVRANCTGCSFREISRESSLRRYMTPGPIPYVPPQEGIQ